MTATAACSKPKRILVVEDDPDIRRLIVLQMRLCQYETVEAANGRLALQLVENGQQFDMVITDAAMPELDGFELTQALRSRPGWSSTPILMLTALDDYPASSQAYQAGVNGFLSKPLDRSEFKATVQSLLYHAAA